MEKTIDVIYKIIYIITAIWSFIQLIVDDKLSLVWVAIILLLGIMAGSYYLRNQKKDSLIIGGSKIYKLNPRIRKNLKKLNWLSAIIIAFLVGPRIYNSFQVKGETKIIVFKIDGPKSDEYRISEIILNELKRSVEDIDGVTVAGSNESINEIDGSEVAIEQGLEKGASFVVWGYYGLTNKKLSIKINFEDFKNNLDPIKKSDGINYSFLNSKELSNSVNNRFFSFDVDLVENMAFQKVISKHVASMMTTFVGILNYNLGNYEDARRLFLKGTLENGLIPKKWILDYQYLGITNYRLGNLVKAIEYYDALIKEFPQELNYYYYRSTFFLDQGQNIKALKDLNMLVDLGSGDLEVFNKRGIANFNLNRINEAFKDLWYVLKVDSTYYRAYSNLASFKTSIKELDSAMYYIDKAINLQPNNSLYVAKKAKIFLEMKDFEKAEFYINKARKIDGGGNYLRFLLVNFYTEKREFSKANQELKMVEQLDSIGPFYYYHRGRIKLRQGFPEKAITDFNRAIHINPNEPYFYAERGSAYNRINLFDEAKSDVDLYLKMRPNDFEGYLARGVILFNNGQFEKSFEDIDKYIELTPDVKEHLTFSNFINLNEISRIFTELAKFLSNSKEQHLKAIKYCDYAIQLKDDNPNAYFVRGAIKTRILQYKDALQDWEVSLILEPDNIKYRLDRARLLTFINSLEGALNDYDKIISLDSLNIEAFLGRSSVFKLMGDLTRACNDWEHLMILGEESVSKEIEQFCN